MENTLAESIFRTQQLSGYREWSKGEYRCLFYVADAPVEDERARGAVYLVDSSFRKGDKLGEYDKLHKSEIDTLPNLQPIAKGFAAFLLTQDYSKWIEDRNILYKWWKLYYEWCLGARPRSGFETEYILQECRNWTIRLEDVIERYLFDPAKVCLYSTALLYVIKDVFRRNTELVNDQMIKWHPYISICTDQSNIDHIRYDYSINAMRGNEKTCIYGIQAVLLQYAAIKQITQEVGRAQNLDRVNELFTNQCGNSLSIESIRIPKYDIEIADKLYEFTLIRSKDIYERTYKLDMSNLMLSEREVDLGFISRLCELELNRYRKKELNPFMSADNLQNMRSFLVGYFIYLFKQMEGYKYAGNLYAEIEAEFPELKRGNLKARTQNLYEEDKYSFVTAKPDDVPIIINKLNEYMMGKSRPKDVMMPIRAAMEAGVIRRPTFSQLQSAFPNCPHNKSLVSLYTNDRQYYFEGEAYKKMVEDFENLL